MQNLFLIPTQSCPAACRYCFTPGRQSRIMGQDTLKTALLLFRSLSAETKEKSPRISFHGGEPLMAGIGFYKKALPLIRNIFGKAVSLSIQTNLWQIDENFISLFREYGVSVGTSLDGPEHINDLQRGKGYFQKTMAGISLLRKHDIKAGCIATFTPGSLPEAETVFNFFVEKGIPFDIHTAVRPVNAPENPDIFLPPSDFGDLLIRMLDLYLRNTAHIKISTLDTLARNISNDQSGLCTFSRCLGDYLAVAPDGGLYSCNRFVGTPDFSLGHCKTPRSLEDIRQSPGWKRLETWWNHIDTECADCLHKNICHGGCPYVGFAHGNGSPRKDPYCQAYKKIYDHILDRGTAEFFSNENLSALTGQKEERRPDTLLQKGPLIQLMNDGPHPFDLAKCAKEIVAAYTLAVTGNPDRAAETLLSLDITKSADRAYPSLRYLRRRFTEPGSRMNNLYLHITSACNLKCSHCYARPFPHNCKSSPERGHGEVHLPTEKIVHAILEAHTLGFNKVVITGGEPCEHPEFMNIAESVSWLKNAETIPQVVLRTNLCRKDRSAFEIMVRSFDEIVVSLDGTKSLHDSRRGTGTYDRTESNIRFITHDLGYRHLSLATVLDYAALSPGETEEQHRHIRRLESELRLSKIRFLPLLPLGRAEKSHARRPPSGMLNVEQWMERGYVTRSTCGLGYVLMTDPDGSVYPCHVCRNSRNSLGSLGSLHTQSLTDIVTSERFRQYKTMTVDTDPECRDCPYKYLCGGICKVWKEKNCSDMRQRSETLLRDAVEILGVSLQINP